MSFVDNKQVSFLARTSGKRFLLVKNSVTLELLSSSISSSFICIVIISVSMLLHSTFSIRSFKVSGSIRIFSKSKKMRLSAFSSSVSMDVSVLLSAGIIVSLLFDSSLSITYCTLSMSV